jgi:hypothetical protein
MELVAAGAPPVIHFAKAVVLLHLGQVDEALQHLDRMVDERTGGCVFLGVDPCVSALAGHPRYEAILKRIGVDPARKASAPHTVST